MLNSGIMTSGIRVSGGTDDYQGGVYIYGWRRTQWVKIVFGETPEPMVTACPIWDPVWPWPDDLALKLAPLTGPGRRTSRTRRRQTTTSDLNTSKCPAWKDLKNDKEGQCKSAEIPGRVRACCTLQWMSYTTSPYLSGLKVTAWALLNASFESKIVCDDKLYSVCQIHSWMSLIICV